MRNYILFLFIAIFAANGFSAAGQDAARMFGADDLHISAKTMSSYQAAPGEHILAFNDNFELIFGDNHLKSSQALIWLKSHITEYRGVTNVEHRVSVYLQDKVSIDRGQGAMTNGVDIAESQLSGVESMVAEFAVSGEVFVTADKQIIEDVRSSELYRNALVATGQVKLVPAAPSSAIASGAPSPGTATYQSPGDSTGRLTDSAGRLAQNKKLQKSQKPGLLAGIFGGPQTPSAETLPPEPPAPKFQYPVNISSLSAEPVKFTSEALADGTSIATIMNRFYLWQKQDEKGGLLEFQADAAVIFYNRAGGSQPGDSNDITAGNTVKAVYLFGDVLMTEGLRTIRADEVYYDFTAKQALAVNSVMRTYDPQRGIPIYLKADRLRQLCENKFKGENVVLTSSEFYVPRIAMTASEIIVTDTTSVDAQTGKVGAHSYDAMLKKVRLKIDNRTVFYWPKVHTNLERPEIPLRRANFGYDSDWGMIAETEWYLTRVLGLKESPGVDSSLMLDYYSKRGVGAGAKIVYKRDNYFGNIDGYIINDSGKDDLGRYRKNIEPPRTLRGNFRFQHRQFMPYNWQLTLETSYMSDEYYAESFNRSEFMTGKEEETLVHLKRLKDNWAFAVMGKWRINDFADQLEELPSAQYHLEGQSLFNDKFTLYNDSSIGSYRQRIGDKHDINISQEQFTFGESRTELDLPLKVGSGKIVPFIAGTFGYDDRSGFARNAVTNVDKGAFGSKDVFIGQVGTRASTEFWKTYRNIHSEFWDVNGIRHIVKPYGNIGLFAESDSVVQQKDYINLGVLQRLQTKRGVGDKQRTVEWMRLNTDITLVSHDESSIRRPDKFLWNNSFVPLAAMSAPGMFNSDLSAYRTFEVFGPQRDSFNADYIWRVSDTMAVLSDMNYDLLDHKVEQYNIGFSRLCLPNLSYYIGARYLRSTNINGEKGSNAVTFAATYKLSSRYTITLAHQYDFDYGKRISTEISLIRRYHRLYYGLTVSQDDSLDRQAIVLSIWPEGVSELSLGSRVYAGREQSSN